MDDHDQQFSITQSSHSCLQEVPTAGAALNDLKLQASAASQMSDGGRKHGETNFICDPKMV